MRVIVKILTVLSFLIINIANATEKEPSFTFNLPDSNGKIHKITTKSDGLVFDGIKDKVVLLNFFGKNCPPCIAEIPHLINLQEKHKKDYEIIGIHVQQRMSKEALDSFVKMKGINYTVIDDDQSFGLVDFIMAKTGWQGMIPFMVLFDKSGSALTTYVGMQDEATLENDLKTALDMEKGSK